ncbi:MrcB family domain-containing protein [Microbacterium sp. NPDC056234]|uniref:MrcB family domain-containing protein n=1 Tax=Microbacterium sp. NPDC056234 TaxID=3345757 RepID=UPI0035D7150F
MRQLLSDVMDLQLDWSVENTEEMQVRGVLIRREIPDWLNENAAAFGVGSAYAVRGQDAVGRKSQVPWVRIYDPELSSRPTEGWYVVYLFSGDGDRCYLSLSHGSFTWDGSAFRPRGSEEMRLLREWARASISLPSGRNFTFDVDLAAQPGTAGASYAGTVAVAIEYERRAVPANEILLSDLGDMLDVLAQVYRADASDPTVPGREPAEVSLAQEQIAAVTNSSDVPRARSGQGFRITKVEQRAVELRAVAVASAMLIASGWTVKDVGATESYDLDCRRGDERLWVEVKGTTSLGEAVILTKNEVALHREKYPANALVVVSEIELDRSADSPVASGGRLAVVSPWQIEDDALQPLAYTYAPASLRRPSV